MVGRKVDDHKVDGRKEAPDDAPRDAPNLMMEISNHQIDDSVFCPCQ